MTKDLLHLEYQRLAISWWKELFGTKLLMRRRKLDYEHFFFFFLGRNISNFGIIMLTAR